MKIVVLGLSLSSSWGNGHATTYRALLKALAGRGHDILFLERDCAWYARHRDLIAPEYCRLVLYSDLADLGAWERAVRRADTVIVGSYVPDGIEVGRWVQETAAGVRAFYDIDTPVTLAQMAAGQCAYLAPEMIPGYDLYLSFTGGPVLARIERALGAPRAAALYCSVDEEAYRPRKVPKRWALGYLGTYSPDRQPGLERLLIAPAHRLPGHRFVVAGPQYPDGMDWPANVERIEHLPPAQHAEFYSSLGWTLNLTRADMTRAGYSPSVRLFEAAACGVPIVSDSWPGLETFFVPDREIALAAGPDDVVAALQKPDTEARRVGEAGERRVREAHTARHRAAELERLLVEAARPPAPAARVLT